MDKPAILAHLLEISNEASLQKLGIFETLIIDGEEYLFDTLCYNSFSQLNDGFGTHLSTYELMQTLEIPDYDTSERLFNLINTGSHQISYIEYSDYLAVAPNHRLIKYFKCFPSILRHKKAVPDPIPDPIPDLIPDPKPEPNNNIIKIIKNKFKNWFGW